MGASASSGLTAAAASAAGTPAAAMTSGAAQGRMAMRRRGGQGLRKALSERPREQAGAGSLGPPLGLMPGACRAARCCWELPSEQLRVQNSASDAPRAQEGRGRRRAPGGLTSGDASPLSESPSVTATAVSSWSEDGAADGSRSSPACCGVGWGVGCRSSGGWAGAGSTNGASSHRSCSRAQSTGAAATASATGAGGSTDSIRSVCSCCKTRLAAASASVGVKDIARARGSTDGGQPHRRAWLTSLLVDESATKASTRGPTNSTCAGLCGSSQVTTGGAGCSKPQAEQRSIAAPPFCC